MCQQTKCCGCIPLRTGCIIIGILAIVNSFALYFDTSVGYGYSIPANLWGLAEGICLLVGAFLNNPTLVLVHFILAIIGIVGLLIAIIVISLTMTVWHATGTAAVAGTAGSTAVTAALAVLIVLVVISCIVKIYFIVVAWSYYKELKTGGEGMSHPA